MSSRRFAAAILRLRREANLTQAQLGQLIRVDPSRISNWETGGRIPNARQLDALATIFGVEKETLVAELFVVNDVERALINDPMLSDDDRHALLTLYLSLARRAV
jgi:transcriptional regulator with XRE-family HTH domain